MKGTTAIGAFVLAVILAAGDQQSSLDAELACETAREMVRLQAQPAPPKPSPAQCSKCKGTGKVKSGDGLAVIPCPECQK